MRVEIILQNCLKDYDLLSGDRNNMTDSCTDKPVSQKEAVWQHACIPERGCLARVVALDSNTCNDRLYVPRHEKTCLRGLQPGKTQTGLLSFRN